MIDVTGKLLWYRDLAGWGARMGWHSLRERKNLIAESRRQSHLWRDADTWEELCELTARFCLGELDFTPNHAGPRCPETVEIADALAHVNRAGYLTMCSQPGSGPDAFGEHVYWQRAAVQGYADDACAARIEKLVADHPALTLSAHRPRRWRGDFRVAVPVTIDEEYAALTDFGAVPSHRQVAFELGGCRDHLVERAQLGWWVTVTDRRWGRHELLWDTLGEL